MFDLAIHGRVYFGELAEAWVSIKDGVIVKVSSEPAGRAAATLELDDGQTSYPPPLTSTSISGTGPKQRRRP